MKEVPVSNGKYTAFVNDEDYGTVSKYVWYIYKSNSNSLYARAKIRTGNKIKKVFMHRFILKAKDGDIIDHIDHNGLNNQRNNIRIANPSINSMNRRNSKKESSTSIYKGVYKKGNRYIARITKDGIEYFYGSYIEEDDAGLAYNRGAIEHFGEYAVLNVIEGSTCKAKTR